MFFLCQLNEIWARYQGLSNSSLQNQLSLLAYGENVALETPDSWIKILTNLTLSVKGSITKHVNATSG